jgi:hypothetical protein
MTLSQLDSLTEDELAMCLHVVNILQPVKPPLEIQPRGLTWFKHDMLVKKIVDSFQEVKPEHHSVYVSLLQKLGVQANITCNPPPEPPTGSAL